MATPRPVPVRRRARSEDGRARWPLLAAVAAVGLALVVGLLADGWRRDRGGPSATPAGEVGCRPTAERPGPLVDLGVQAATGDPRRPLLSEQVVGRLVDRAARAGAAVISTPVSWPAVKPTAAAGYRWTVVDRVVDAARARGLEVRVQLVHTPEWAVEQEPGRSIWHPPTTDAELERWADFAGAVARHLQGRVRYVEVWTEPNQREFWATGPDPAAFARLLATTYDAVEAVDPDVQVVSGGLGGNDLGYLEALYDALEESGRTEPVFDMLGVHPFTNGLGPEERIPARRYESDFGTYDESFLAYRDLHGLMAERGDGDVPVHIGQFGYTTKPFRDSAPVSDAVRAGYLTEAYAAATCTPYVAVLSWYYLHPTRFDPASWTLLDEDLRPNRTYRALQEWTRQVRAAAR